MSQFAPTGGIGHRQKGSRASRSVVPAGPIRLGAGEVRLTIHARDLACRSLFATFFRSFGPPPSRPVAHLQYRMEGPALYRDGTPLGRFRQPLRAAHRIVLDLGEQVPALCRGHLGLHAAAVSLRGRGLLLPAPLKGGKSTLTLGLVRGGCTYYSDDVAILDLRDLRLSPFPRPIDLRRGALDLFPPLGRGLLPISSEGGGESGPVAVRVDRRRTGRARAPVRWIVFPHLRLGGVTVVEPLPGAEALVRLSRLAFNLDRVGARGFEALVSLIRGAECYSLEVGRLREGLRALFRLLGTPRGRSGRHRPENR